MGSFCRELEVAIEQTVSYSFSTVLSEESLEPLTNASVARRATNSTLERIAREQKLFFQPAMAVALNASVDDILIIDFSVVQHFPSTNRRSESSSFVTQAVYQLMLQYTLLSSASVIEQISQIANSSRSIFYNLSLGANFTLGNIEANLAQVVVSQNNNYFSGVDLALLTDSSQMRMHALWSLKNVNVTNTTVWQSLLVRPALTVGRLLSQRAAIMATSIVEWIDAAQAFDRLQDVYSLATPWRVLHSAPGPAGEATVHRCSSVLVCTEACLCPGEQYEVTVVMHDQSQTLWASSQPFKLSDVYEYPPIGLSLQSNESCLTIRWTLPHDSSQDVV
jgi:hypothetical protein